MPKPILDPAIKSAAKAPARMSKKDPLTQEQLSAIDAWWRAANYLSACQLYLLDNPLLREPLRPEHLKSNIVGHWGTCPGQNFIYTHLNRVIVKYDLNMIYICGPGHGGNAVVAQDYLDGSYSEIYPNISQDTSGLKQLFRLFHVQFPLYFIASRIVLIPHQIRYTATMIEPIKSSQIDNCDAGAITTDNNAVVTQPSTSVFAR